MKTLLTSKLVLTIVGLNLLLGNFVLLRAQAEFSHHIAMSISAICVLLAGFKCIEKMNAGWQAAAFGLIFTLLIPIVGSFFLALLASPGTAALSTGNLLLAAAGFALIMGTTIGWLAALPFLLFNMPGFYGYWRELHLAH